MGSSNGNIRQDRNRAGTAVLRPYEPADCEQLLDVWTRASALAHPFLGKAFMEQERRNIPDVSLPIAETWVWAVDGRVTGFISLLGNEVGALFVDPDCHRGGIGRSLIEQARTLRGDLEVEVFERNALGRRFYEHVGFKLIERKIHEPTGFELLRLRLEADHSDSPKPDAAPGA